MFASRECHCLGVVSSQGLNGKNISPIWSFTDSKADQDIWGLWMMQRLIAAPIATSLPTDFYL